MQKYKLLMLDSITRNDGRIIPTVDFEQAHLMTHHMISKAEKSMNIIVGKGSQEIYDDAEIGARFLQLLNRGVRVNAVLLAEPVPASRRYELLNRYADNYKNLSVKVITNKSSEVLSRLMENESQGALSSFATFDDNIFRLEMLSKHYKAIGSFNNKKYTEKLNNVFAPVFEHSASIFPELKL